MRTDHSRGDSLASPSPLSGAGDIIENVIDARMCIGCGACAFAEPGVFSIGMTPEGHFRAAKAPHAETTVNPAICPMSGAGADETALAGELYPDLPEQAAIGRHLSTFVCHVDEGDYRQRGGSGGLVTWLAAELLKQGKVDAILHVKPLMEAQTDGLLFGYGVSRNVEEVRAGAKSRYYPIEMSDVLRLVRDTNERFAVIGLPCFIKAVRLLEKQGLIPAGRIAYCIGLVCGHLKSRHFADYLAWQKGGEPGRLKTFDFRFKIPNRAASDYGFSFESIDQESASTARYWPMREVKGKNWGEGQFKNPACEYCEDVLAECADIVVGDAWLPGYVDDYMGTNVAVTRDKDIDTLIHAAAERGAIQYDEVGPADVIRSQASGIRHRREGTAHRLQRRKAAGKWYPQKRIRPVLAPAFFRRLIYDLRLAIADRSSPIFAEVLAHGDTIGAYERRMRRYLEPYRLVIRCSNLAKDLARVVRRRGRPHS